MTCMIYASNLNLPYFSFTTAFYLVTKHDAQIRLIQRNIWKAIINQSETGLTTVMHDASKMKCDNNPKQQF